MQKYFPFTILTLIVLIVGYLVYKPSCRRLDCLTLANLAEYKVKEVYQDDKTVYRAMLTRDQDLLRAEVHSQVSSSQASQDVQAQITRMQALFAKAVSPYPGEISQEIVCGQKFTPEFKTYEKDGLLISYFNGYLNSRLVFGACTEDQAIYRGYFALFYCPKQKQLFQLEIIAPTHNFNKSPQKYNQILESIRCRK
ncbi:MAG: hypothetical protein ACOY0S_03465 [Patescibacteria group bacterium]